MNLNEFEALKGKLETLVQSSLANYFISETEINYVVKIDFASESELDYFTKYCSSCFGSILCGSFFFQRKVNQLTIYYRKS